MTELPLVLSLDTATLGGSVCLMRGDQLLASVIGDREISHSRTLLRDIDRVLKNAGVAIPEIRLFAVAAGPGSFTGLRIGLATVKALSATLDRPCVGIPTLHAVARAGGTSKTTVALLPAGRGELFAQLLSVSSAGVVEEHDVPAHLPPSALVEKYGAIPDLIWAGPGAQVQRDFLRDQAHNLGIEFESSESGSHGWKIAPRDENLAKEIATLAQQHSPSGPQGSAESLRAIYVRPSDPELKACQ
ncbi:MAG: tRNA (adenosine(37)-N6)-threonylcarbamoyltransferase complex dimerization subunit type 1 TsaB [Acidobacteriota bacterium]|nr:tRNA (adenosine(37)-N6)-threonylcarbamoyltransferase complex dimerization subunit type 1 TsaB [Acidobacteriota bacterium]